MRLGPERRWMPFTAEQRMRSDRTAFVWHARFKMAPLVTAVVEDAFEDGKGRLDAKVWGLVPVAHARGPKVDRGEAQRYLAELPWCPLALWENPELRFRQLDARTVRVWVFDEATSMDLVFDDAGDIVRAHTDARCRDETSEPWGGEFGEYREFGAIRAPSSGHVAWRSPEGDFEYWRGEILDLDFEC